MLNKIVGMIGPIKTCLCVKTKQNKKKIKLN